MAKVTVVGGGYVGTCTAVALAHLGHAVHVVEAEPQRRSLLANGRLPLREPGLDEAWRAHMAAGRLSVAQSLPAALADAEAVFLCVPTPARADGSLDASALADAARDVGRGLRAAATLPLVVVKSTVTPGTTEGVVLPALAGQAGRHVPAVVHPEFLREGRALRDALEPDRLVVGAADPADAARLWRLLDGLPGRRLETDLRTAEAVKLFTNALLALKVSAANELANLGARLGVRWDEVAKGIGLDPRIGPDFLAAGPGFGGSCLPKDLDLVRGAGVAVGVPTGLLDAAAQVNRRQPEAVLQMLRQELGGVRGRTIAILGLAFKPGTDDVRGSKALELASTLMREGATVRGHDPWAGPAFARLAPGVDVAAGLDEALAGADGCIVQADWDAYRSAGPETFAGMRGKVVVDSRRCLDAARLREAGFVVRAVGVPDPRDSRSPS